MPRKASRLIPTPLRRLLSLASSALQDVKDCEWREGAEDDKAEFKRWYAALQERDKAREYREPTLAKFTLATIRAIESQAEYWKGRDTTSYQAIKGVIDAIVHNLETLVQGKEDPHAQDVDPVPVAIKLDD